MLEGILLSLQLTLAKPDESNREHYPPPVPVEQQHITSYRRRGPVVIVSIDDSTCGSNGERHIVFDDRYPGDQFPVSGACLPNGTRFKVLDAGPLAGHTWIDPLATETEILDSRILIPVTATERDFGDGMLRCWTPDDTQDKKLWSTFGQNTTHNSDFWKPKK